MYDFREMSLMTAARLACGLSEDSRARMKCRGDTLSFGRLLAVLSFDVLSQVRFYAARAAGYKVPFPQALYRQLVPHQRGGGSNTDGFDSAEDFEREKARIIGEV